MFFNIQSTGHFANVELQLMFRKTMHSTLFMQIEMSV